MKTYRINEIFYSLQGEGAFTGTPMVFVRFSGCNRRCSFCDTEFDSFSEMTAGEIEAEVSKFPARRIVFTGGEPLLQLDENLISRLKSNGYALHIETNGTLPVPDGLDWVTCSPKDPVPKIQPDKVDELKVVYTGQTPDELEKIRSFFKDARCFFLQPCSGENISETVACVLGSPQWRLSLQTHKLIDIK